MAWTPSPRKRPADMTCEELRSELKKLGRKMAGTKSELQDRILEPCQRNDRAWARNWEEQLDGCPTYLDQGEFRNVYLQRYDKGPRKGELAVWKVFKSGATYEDKFFKEDVKAVGKATELICKFTRYLEASAKKVTLANFASGNRVRWISSDEDIPQNEVGSVVGFNDTEVRVQFARGTFTFDPSSLKHTRNNFTIGKYVHWSGDDAGAPAGSVGKVVGFTDEGRVEVQFPNGCWNFLPSELRLSTAPAPQRIYINEPGIWTVEDSGKKGLVEPFLGRQFMKFNSNSGWSESSRHPLMQALSHYSYHVSDGAYLVCDLQGVAKDDHYILTDPVVLSKDKEFGTTDGGVPAMEQFFAHHRCGPYCRPHWKRIRNPVQRYAVRSGTTFFNR
mmetsp:Transcript_29420/g.62625  ORF Transcript_29420/g.62625 Transcript_29420/m.62625 type:complete len:389 (+) Transcript_29420:80-1246(+)